MNMKRMLIFHPALAPYRIDQFNSLCQLFDLEVIFIFDNVWNHKFDQSKLLSQLKFKYSFLLKGPCYKGRVFRFGIFGAIKRINPDIIIGYEYSFTTQYLILLKKLGFINQKIGSTIDDSIDICTHIQSKIRFLARTHTVKHLNFLVVLSIEVSLFYQNLFKLNEQQIIVSPILQEPERLRNNPIQLAKLAIEYVNKYKLLGKKVLLFVGRFIPEKALPGFLNNISSILHQRENLVLVFVGDGIDKKNIETIITEKHLDGKVLLPGRFESSDLYAWYLCASGFVIPSTYEPFGAVVNEALIFGLKVLCSKYAGASTLIQSYNGLIFDPLSEKDTCNKLIEFSNWIDKLENIDMSKKPSLISNNQNYLSNEWRKI